MSLLTFSWLAMQVSYAIGVAQPLSVHVDSYGTGSVPDKEILQAVLKNFDFRPGALHPLACQARLSGRAAHSVQHLRVSTLAAAFPRSLAL